jgi:hypothetical protein
MFTGRSLHESFGPLAGPAMTVFRDTLILAWSGADGSIYSAMDMQDDGTINAWRLPDDRSDQRLSLAYHRQQDTLLLGYSGQDNNAWLARTDDGGTFKTRDQWLQPVIGGLAMQSDTVTLVVAYTTQDTQQVTALFTTTPPDGGFNDSPSGYAVSIDTPGLVLTTSGPLIAFAGTDEPGFSLNATYVGEHSGPDGVHTFSDQCLGGPNLVQLPQGYAAAYTGHNRNLYLLFGIESLDENTTTRWKFTDTSPWPPAFATLNDETYVAWFGTDGDNKLNFAHLSAMPMTYQGGSG